MLNTVAALFLQGRVCHSGRGEEGGSGGSNLAQSLVKGDECTWRVKSSHEATLRTLMNLQT